MTTEPEPTGLEWIKLRQDMDSYPIESTKAKFLRKFEENPVVPIGCLTTVGALSYGLWCFKNGLSKRSQQMMRLRVGAQAFTITALLAGVIITATTKARTTK